MFIRIVSEKVTGVIDWTQKNHDGLYKIYNYWDEWIIPFGQLATDKKNTCLLILQNFVGIRTNYSIIVFQRFKSTQLHHKYGIYDEAAILDKPCLWWQSPALFFWYFSSVFLSDKLLLHAMYPYPNIIIKNVKWIYTSHDVTGVAKRGTRGHPPPPRWSES